MFFIAEGHGEARVGSERTAISAGDVVYVPPFTHHAFANTSAQDDLRYVSVWWEDGPLLRRTHEDWTGAGVRTTASTVLLTATPPTVNGPLHLGHISGPYLAADVCRRSLTMRHHTVISVSGSDENQSYVVTKARQKGWTPRATADHFGDEVERGLAALDVRPQVFARPSTSPYHSRFCQDFLARLYADGKLRAPDLQRPFTATRATATCSRRTSRVCAPTAATPRTGRPARTVRGRTTAST